MTQQALMFDAPIKVQPRDQSVPEAAKPRLSRQCQQIVERLRRGRASNAELATISLKYGGRLSDARQAGYVIRCVNQDHRTGYAEYELVREP